MRIETPMTDHWAILTLPVKSATISCSHLFEKPPLAATIATMDATAIATLYKNNSSLSKILITQEPSLILDK
jgi:hypothetical protein